MWYFLIAWRFALSHYTSGEFYSGRLEFPEPEAASFQLVVGVVGRFESYPGHVWRLCEKHQVRNRKTTRTSL